MQRVIIPILGFTQKARRVSGLELLWRRLRDFSTRMTCIYKPMLWDSDWRGEAELLQRHVASDPLIVIIAYSWGAGWGFIRLAEALGSLKTEKGEPAPISIRVALLADPVYRRPWVPDFVPFNPTSLLSFPKIIVPPNVAEVVWTRQRKSRPCGHDLIAAAPQRTRIHKCIVLDLPHHEMDDAAVFHEQVLSTIRSL